MRRREQRDKVQQRHDNAKASKQCAHRPGRALRKGVEEGAARLIEDMRECAPEAGKGRRGASGHRGFAGVHFVNKTGDAAQACGKLEYWPQGQLRPKGEMARMCR